MQINSVMERCIEEFKNRHPSIPMDSLSLKGAFKVGAEMIAVSAIPVVNIFLGYYFSNFDETVISEVIENVEAKYWMEIQEAEEEISSRLDDLDKYF